MNRPIAQGNKEAIQLPINYREPKILHNKYVIKHRISAGSFGVVYLAVDKTTKENVAVKIERTEHAHMGTLNKEVQLLQMMKGLDGVPQVLWSGQEQGLNVMVLDFLGRDLGELIKARKRFTTKTGLQILYRLITIMQGVHKKGIVHRDLKPENILLNLEENDFYLVDYGVSKTYLDHGRHIPFRLGKSFTGTVRYASRAAHQGHEISRKDDLESLFYVCIFFMKGRLPWQSSQGMGDKMENVGLMKQTTDPRDLCRDIPFEIAECLNYLKMVKFSEEPNYDLLTGKVKQAGQRLRIEFENIFDWTPKKTQRNTRTPEHSPKASDASPLIPQSPVNSPNAKSQRSVSPSERKLTPPKSKGGSFLIPPTNGSKAPSHSSGSSIVLNFVPTLIVDTVREGLIQLGNSKAVSSPNIKISLRDSKKSRKEKESQFELDDEYSVDSPSLEQKYSGLVSSQVQAQFLDSGRQNCVSSINFFQS